MTTQAEAYIHAIYPPSPWQHLSDEDIAAQLDKSEKRRRAARKAADTRKQKQAGKP